MDTFFQTLGFVLAICVGIVLLVICFTVLGSIKRWLSGPAVLKMKGFLKDAKFVHVHLNGGKILQRVRFVGFTDQSSMKAGNIPFHLSNMVVLETETGARILIRADSVRMIEEIQDA